MDPYSKADSAVSQKQYALAQMRGANAQNAAAYAAVKEPRPMTHTESVTNSLESLLASLNDSNARLQEARDRMFGCQPETGGQGTPTPVPNGRVDEIDMMLGACHSAADRNQNLAAELLRRL